MKMFFGSVFITLAVTSVFAIAQNQSRYPRENAAYAGDIIGSFRGTFDEFFIVSLQAGVDPSFSHEEKNIIAKGVDVFMKRALQEDVLDCTFANAKKDLPESRDSFKKQLYEAISPIHVEGVRMPAFAFIARYWADSKSVGLGFPGLFYDRDNPLPGYNTRHYLHIALNSDHMGTESDYAFSNNHDYWAGVIGHEFLHNLGYRHPTGYPGSFIKEYGNCVWQNGVSSQILEQELPDTVVEKELGL